MTSGRATQMDPTQLRPVARAMFAPEPQAAVAPEQQAAPQTLGTLPTEVDLVLYSGDDFFLDLTVSAAQGGPANLTGAIVLAQIRSSATTTQVQATFTSTITTNVIHLHLPGAASENLAGNSTWDCQITDANSVVSTLARGSVTITADVSHV